MSYWDLRARAIMLEAIERAGFKADSLLGDEAKEKVVACLVAKICELEMKVEQSDRDLKLIEAKLREYLGEIDKEIKRRGEKS